MEDACRQVAARNRKDGELLRAAFSCENSLLAGMARHAILREDAEFGTKGLSEWLCEYERLPWE